MVRYILLILLFCSFTGAEEISIFGNDGIDIFDNTAESYKPRVIMYSPSWHCVFCDKMKTEFKTHKNNLFEVEYIVKDGFPEYPRTTFSTPREGDNNWMTVTGYYPYKRFMKTWYNNHPDYKEELTLKKLQSLRLYQIRGVLSEYEAQHDTVLATYGTTSGMTVKYHLLNDHGFSISQINGLSLADMNRLHSLAHQLE